MSKSIQEEILSAIWAICALLAFGFGFSGWGWVFAAKAAIDTAFAIGCGIRELVNEQLNTKDGGEEAA